MDRSASDEAAAEFEEVGAVEFLQRRAASSAQGRREAESDKNKRDQRRSKRYDHDQNSKILIKDDGS